MHKELLYKALAIVIIALLVIGLLLANAAWIIFIIATAAKIFGLFNHPWFALTEFSVIGTPIELFVGGAVMMVIAGLLRSSLLRRLI